MLLCPCGSKTNYADCCALYIEEKQLPQTPEQLMRSRYTAYSQANMKYIKKTMKGNALLGFNEAEAHQWAQSVRWKGLEVIQAEPATSNIGYVEFAAHFLDEGKAQMIHEISEFHREDGVWFYVQGVHKARPIKEKKAQTSRNAPCPCGSGRKFKNCHDK